MSDWINTLKKQDKEQQDYERGVNELRLHKAKVVKTKAPSFWSATLDQIQKDIETLKKEYPEDSTRHVTLTRNGQSVTLENKVAPIRTMELTLDLNGQCIIVQTAETKDLFHKGILKPKEPLPISVDHQENLSIVWEGSHETTPSRISEKFIKHVLDIPW